MLSPTFIPPERFGEPATALAHAGKIYEQSIAFLRQALARFIAGE